MYNCVCALKTGAIGFCQGTAYKYFDGLVGPPLVLCVLIAIGYAAAYFFSMMMHTRIRAVE